MKKIGELGIALGLAWGSLAGATAQQPVPPAVSQAIAAATKTKPTTKYSVGADSTTVVTTLKDNKSFDQQMSKYFFPVFQKAMQNQAFVSSIEQTPGTESIETNQWWDYTLHTKRSNIFVSLKVGTPISMLFQIEDSYRECTKKPVASYSEDGGASASTCTGQSELKVTGPLAIYGNFATAVNVDKLLRNKQDLDIILNKSYDGNDTLLSTSFNIKSAMFDENLARFFHIFNLPVFTESSGDIGFSRSGILDKVAPLTSRQRLLVGISRIARQVNERMVGK